MADPQYAVCVDNAFGERLEQAIRVPYAWPDRHGEGIKRVELYFRSRHPRFMAAVTFDPELFDRAAHDRFAYWCRHARGRVVTLHSLDMGERDRFTKSLDECDIHLPACSVQDIRKSLEDLLKRIADKPRGTVPGRTEMLLDLASPQAADHYRLTPTGIFIRSALSPPVGDEIWVDLKLPGQATTFEVLTQVSYVRKAGHVDPGTSLGFGLRFMFVEPEHERLLTAHLGAQPEVALRVHARVRVLAPVKVTRPGGHDGDAGTATRSARLAYRSPGDFIGDYVRNLSAGGAFIRTDQPLPIGARVQLAIEVPGGKPMAISGEVVSQRETGVGIQFTPDPAVQGQLEEAVERLLNRPPAVLLLDQEPTHLRRLSEQLRAAGLQVRTAGNEKVAVDALEKQGDGLDLVLAATPLGAPDVDLLEAVRTRSGSAGVFYAVLGNGMSEEQVAGFHLDGINLVLEERVGIPVLCEQIRNAVQIHRRA